MPRDHRPRMPEVACRSGRRVASCPQDERASPPATRRRSLTARLCSTARRPPEFVSYVGQRAAPATSAHAPAGAGDRRTSRATIGTAAAPRTGPRVPGACPHVADRRPDGATCRHFSVKSVFGRPRRLATRAATAPHNFPHLLRVLRRRLRLTQGGLAKRIGAAGNASSISGSRGSERRRRSFGNACCDWNTALHAGPGCVLKLQCHRL